MCLVRGCLAKPALNKAYCTAHMKMPKYRDMKPVKEICQGVKGCPTTPMNGPYCSKCLIVINREERLRQKALEQERIQRTPVPRKVNVAVKAICQGVEGCRASPRNGTLCYDCMTIINREDRKREKAREKAERDREDMKLPAQRKTNTKSSEKDARVHAALLDLISAMNMRS